MTIVISGGSGQVGTVLARAFHSDGHDVVVLSRHPETRPWRVVMWDGATPGHWTRDIRLRRRRQSGGSQRELAS
jgi:nucleoside-diphosphate-sugar epimerase